MGHGRSHGGQKKDEQACEGQHGRQRQRQKRWRESLSAGQGTTVEDTMCTYSVANQACAATIACDDIKVSIRVRGRDHILRKGGRQHNKAATLGKSLAQALLRKMGSWRHQSSLCCGPAATWRDSKRLLAERSGFTLHSRISRGELNPVSTKNPAHVFLAASSIIAQT